MLPRGLVKTRKFCCQRKVALMESRFGWGRSSGRGQGQAGHITKHLQPTAETAHFFEGVLVEQWVASEAVGLMRVSVR